MIFLSDRLCSGVYMFSKERKKMDLYVNCQWGTQVNWASSCFPIFSVNIGLSVFILSCKCWSFYVFIVEISFFSITRTIPLSSFLEIYELQPMFLVCFSMCWGGGIDVGMCVCVFVYVFMCIFVSTSM